MPRSTTFGTVPSGGDLAEGFNLGLKLRVPGAVPLPAELAGLGDEPFDFAHHQHPSILMDNLCTTLHFCVFSFSFLDIPH